MPDALPLDEPRYEVKSLVCVECGYEAVCVWPTKTSMRELECGACAQRGTLVPKEATQH